MVNKNCLLLTEAPIAAYKLCVLPAEATTTAYKLYVLSAEVSKVVYKLFVPLAETPTTAYKRYVLPMEAPTVAVKVYMPESDEIFCNLGRLVSVSSTNSLPIFISRLFKPEKLKPVQSSTLLVASDSG